MGMAFLFPENACASWYSASWLYRKQITIDASMTPNSDQTNFPVLIYKASDTDFAADAQADADDFVFTASDGITKLDHEIEKFNSSTGELVAWVEIPTLANASNTVIYVYYGNASASNQENASGTWNSDYKGVWHMAEDPSITTDGDCGGGTAEECDSTSNNSDGDSNGTMTSGDLVAGQIGNGLDFDGTDDYINVPHTASINFNDTLTAELWVKGNSPNNSYGRIIWKGEGVTGWQLTVSNTGPNLHFRVDTSGGVNQTKTLNTVFDGSWYHVVLVLDSGTVKIYKNSSLDVNSTYTHGAGFAETGSALRFAFGVSTYLAGQLDEVRVSSVVRDANWITTSYNNQSAPATYLTFGSESVLTVAGTVYSDEGATNVGAGKTVRLVVNGASAGTDTTDASGNYFFNASVSSGDALIVYIDGDATYDGTAVTVSDGTNLTGLDIYADHLITRHDNGGSLTNALMNTALGAYSDAEILYSYSGGNVTVSGSATELFVPAGHTFDPQGNVTTAHVDINGTLTGGTATITVSGNFDSNAGTFTAGASSVVLNDSGNVNSTGDTFYDLTVGNGASSETTTITSDLRVSNILTIVDSNDTLTDAGGGFDITVSGTGTPFVNNGSTVDCEQFKYSSTAVATINAAGGTYNVNDVLWFGGGNGSSGTTFKLNGNLIVNGNLLLYGASGLTFLDTDAANNYSISTNNFTIGNTAFTIGVLTSNASTIDVNGNLLVNATIITPQINANTSTWTVAGNWTIPSTFFSPGTSTVTLDGTSDQTINMPSSSFNNLTLNNTGASGSDDIIIAANLDVNGTFTITDGDLDVSTNDKNVNLAGSMAVAAAGTIDNSAYTGTWTFDGSGTSTLTDNTAGGLDYKSMTVNGTAKVIQLASSGTPTFTFNTLTIGADDTLDLNGQDITITTLDNSGTLLLEGAETVSITTMDTNSGTVKYDGAGPTYTGLAAGNNYYHLTLDNAAASWNLNAALDTNGNLTITNGTLDASGSNYAVTVGGNWSNAGSYISGANTTTFDGTGTQTIDSGGVADNQDFNAVVHSASGTVQLVNNHIDIDATFTNSAGTWQSNGKNMYVASTWVNSATFTAGTDTVYFDGAGTSVSSGGSPFYNLSTSAASLIPTASNDLDVNGNFSMTSGIVAPLCDYINVAGNFSISSGATFTKTSLVAFTFDGTTASTVTDSNATKQDLGAVIYNKTDTVAPSTNNKVTLASDISATSISVDGTSGQEDVLVTDGYEIQLSSGITVNGTLNATDGTDGASTLTVSGNWNSNAGAFTPGSSSVVLDGSPSINSTGDTFYNLTVGNASATATAAITSALTVSNVLTIVDSNDVLTDAAGGFNITVSGSGTPFVNNGASVTANQFNFTSIADGPILVSGGTYNLTDRFGIVGGNGGSGSTFRINGNLIVNGDILVAPATPGELIYFDTDSTSDYSVTAEGLTVGSNATDAAFFLANGSTIDINGNATVTSTVASNIIADTSSWTVSGNWDAAKLNSGTSTFTFDGTSGTKTIDPNTTSFYNVVFNDAGGTATFELQAALTAANDFTLTDGIFDTKSGSNYAFTVTNDLSVDGGTFTANASTITVSGNMDTNAGTFTAGASSVVLNGTGTLDSTGDTFYNLTVGNGASSETTTVTSDLDVTNVLTIVDSGDALTDAGGGFDITVTGTGTPFVNNGATTTCAIFEYSSKTDLTAAGGTYTVSDKLYFSGGDFTTKTKTLNGNLVVNGNLMIAPASIVNFLALDTDVANNYSVTVNGNLTVGDTGVIQAGKLSANASTVDINGNVVLNSGTGSQAVNAGSSSWTVSGNWTVDAVSNGWFVAGTSTVTFDGSADQTYLSSSLNSPFYDLVLNNSGVNGVSDSFIISTGGFSALKVNNDFTITDGDLDMATNNAYAYFLGDVTVSANGTVSQGSNLITFSSTGASILTDNTAAGQNYKSVTVNGTAANLQLASSGTPTFTFNTLTIGADDTVDLNGKNTTITTLDNSGILQLEGGEAVTITTMDANSGTVLYDGAGTYTQLAAGDAYYNLKINNAATGSWTLDAALSVGNDLTLTDGILDTKSGSNYAVTVANDLTMTGGTFNGNASTITVTAGDLALDGTESSTQLNNASIILNGAGNLAYSNLAFSYSYGFNNLTVGQSGNTTSWTGGDGGLAVRGVLTIGSGTLTGSKILYLVGNTNPLSFDAASTLDIDELRFIGSTQNIPTLTNGYDCTIRTSKDSQVVTQTGNVTINGAYNLNLDGDTFVNRTLTYAVNGYNLVVGGSIYVGAGNDTALKTLDGTNSSITVGGDFDIKSIGTGSSQAVFTSSGSTVTLNGTALQTVNMNGSNFNNLVQTNASAAGVSFTDSFSVGALTNTTAGSKMTFDDASTYTITGSLTLDGASGNEITLLSDNAGSRFTVDNQTGAMAETTFLNLKDSEVSTDSIRARSSINNGNLDSNEASPRWVLGPLRGATVIVE